MIKQVKYTAFKMWPSDKYMQLYMYIHMHCKFDLPYICKMSKLTEVNKTYQYTGIPGYMDLIQLLFTRHIV